MDKSLESTIDFRGDLLALLDKETRQRMSAALLREATEGNKSGSVLKAYELVREIIEGCYKPFVLSSSDLKNFSDDELRNMLRRIETENESSEFNSA